jgi:hypothetical protein
LLEGQQILLTRDSVGKTPLEWAQSRLERFKASSSVGIQKELENIVNIFYQYMIETKRPPEDIYKMEIIKEKLNNAHSIQDVDEIEAMLKSLSF